MTNKKEKKTKSEEKESSLWLIKGAEELPLGLCVAKTKGGAEKVYATRTGVTRGTFYAEPLKFKKQFVGFTSLT